MTARTRKPMKAAVIVKGKAPYIAVYETAVMRYRELCEQHGKDNVRFVNAPQGS